MTRRSERMKSYVHRGTDRMTPGRSMVVWLVHVVILGHGPEGIIRGKGFPDASFREKLFPLNTDAPPTGGMRACNKRHGYRVRKLAKKARVNP
ncbi:hypothetical protein TNIN_224721 [Trichonephila inaurata madagascariensis]|uniref:Uncharacterized protein n=1 Tax=Trichonephila inaurata madagascariensis TaxID=2747483 RepID=A0A8X6YC66_9ARAC|nr:hypothetical protein TNIN_224721 [Trichonephila inaurata madagascariensis]